MMNGEGRLTIVLRPAIVISMEDEWAYGPKHREELARVLGHSREGRVGRLSEADLDALAASTV